MTKSGKFDQDQEGTLATPIKDKNWLKNEAVQPEVRVHVHLGPWDGNMAQIDLFSNTHVPCKNGWGAHIWKNALY